MLDPLDDRLGFFLAGSSLASGGGIVEEGRDNDGGCDGLGADGMLLGGAVADDRAEFESGLLGRVLDFPFCLRKCSK